MPAQSLPIIDLENLDIDALRKVTHEIGFFFLTDRHRDQQLTRP